MKRPKKATVRFIKTEAYYSEYNCPHCYTLVKGAGVEKNVTRFLCKYCDNEIIVEHEKCKD